MTGRFLTGAFFLCAVLLARYWTFARVPAPVVLALIVVSGMCVRSPAVTSARADFGLLGQESVVAAGIADERAFWYPCAGLLRYHKQEGAWYLPRPNTVHPFACSDVSGQAAQTWPDAYFAHAGVWVRQQGIRVIVVHNIGLFGYFAGPNIHIVDDLA